MPSKSNSICLLSGLVILLSACGVGNQSSTLESKQTLPTTQAKAPQVKELKPGANISLLSENILIGTVNHNSKDVISLSVPRDKVWEIKLLSDPEVDIQSDVEFQIPIADSIAAVNPNKYDIEFRWLPKKVGRYYLRVHASNSSAESSEVREFALILDVSNINSSVSSQMVQLKKSGIESKAASTHSVMPDVIELPADEIIRSKK